MADLSFGSFFLLSVSWQIRLPCLRVVSFADLIKANHNFALCQIENHPQVKAG